MTSIARVKITDVAKAANVSKTAVSQVLNNVPIWISDEKRQAILNAAEKLNYRPHTGARRVSLQRTETIGLVYPDNLSSPLSSIYLFALTQSIASRLNAEGYDTLLLMQRKTESLHASRFTDPGRIDGTIIIGDRAGVKPSEKSLFHSTHPHAFIGSIAGQSSPHYSIDFDVSTGAYEMTRHLIELGHERILFLAGVPSPLKKSSFQRAMDEAQLDSRRCQTLSGPLQEGHIEEILMAHIQGNQPVSAIFAANDSLAILVIKTLHRLGVKVPEHISVSGFDDTELARAVTPPLTTVHLPMDEMADATVKMIMAQISKSTPTPSPKVIPVELKLRLSTSRRDP